MRLPSWWPGAKAPWRDATRWVVLDVETTGLDRQRCQLLAVAALAVHRDGSRLRIQASDSFEVGLHHVSAGPVDKGNILLHHIGLAEQRRGIDAAQALNGFVQWVDSAPLFGFHVQFDRDVLLRGGRQVRAAPLQGPWIDLAPLASLSHPEVPARALDEWLQHFGIDCAQRHQAAADVWSTAELLLRLWPALLAQQAGHPKAMLGLIEQRRWLERSSR